jgi:hypothetical protein
MWYNEREVKNEPHYGIEGTPCRRIFIGYDGREEEVQGSAPTN